MLAGTPRGVPPGVAFPSHTKAWTGPRAQPEGPVVYYTRAGINLDIPRP